MVLSEAKAVGARSRRIPIAGIRMTPVLKNKKAELFIIRPILCPEVDVSAAVLLAKRAVGYLYERRDDNEAEPHRARVEIRND